MTEHPSRVLRRLAWGLFALVVIVSPVPFMALEIEDQVLFVVGFVAVQVSMAGVGAFVADRQPRHRIGWLLLGMGVGLALRQAAGAYAELGNLTSHGPLPGDDVAAWLSGWPFIPIVAGGIVYLLHLFPDGQFLSRRWRLVGFGTAVMIVLISAGDALKPGPLDSIESVSNPVGAKGWLADVDRFLVDVSGILALLVIVAAGTSMGSRVRRSSGVEREQIKWIAFVLALVAVFIAGSAVLPDPWAWISLLLGLASLATMPVAAGVAILRYRLYDIDVVINRAIVYGALTATLVSTYLGSVLLLQLLLRQLAGGSSLAVAASTLTAAALVRPARTRIQNSVDRRFFRAKYNGALTLERFGAQVRSQVDVDAVERGLRTVVAQTMQPAHLSLWLRGSHHDADPGQPRAARRPSVVNR
ncbi:MAG: hypothetical protein ACJ716_17090 [Marmoricola sp.]